MILGEQHHGLAAGRQSAAGECSLAIKFAGVSLIGFATDAIVLHLVVAAGLEPAWARLISLTCAMQATFIINGLQVFRALDRKRWPHQWLRYMLAGGAGNVCNYWIFVTLVSTHWRIIATPLFALAVGSFAAWIINFFGARFFVFRKARGPLAALVTREPEAFGPPRDLAPPLRRGRRPV
jgi:putative flippase GtrA